MKNFLRGGLRRKKKYGKVWFVSGKVVPVWARQFCRVQKKEKEKT
jgi:hypothetical protein